MPTDTRNPQDNWAHFRRLVEQQIKLTEAQLDLWQSILEEGDEADHIDFVQQLEFDATVTTLTVVAEAKQTRRVIQATNRLRHWTEAEHDDLRAMFRYGLTDAQIAEFLGRSQDSIERRRGVLGLLRNV